MTITAIPIAVSASVILTLSTSFMAPPRKPTITKEPLEYIAAKTPRFSEVSFESGYADGLNRLPRNTGVHPSYNLGYAYGLCDSGGGCRVLTIRSR